MSLLHKALEKRQRETRKEPPTAEIFASTAKRTRRSGIARIIFIAGSICAALALLALFQTHWQRPSGDLTRPAFSPTVQSAKADASDQTAALPAVEKAPRDTGPKKEDAPATPSLPTAPSILPSHRDMARDQSQPPPQEPTPSTKPVAPEALVAENLASQPPKTKTAPGVGGNAVRDRRPTAAVPAGGVRRAPFLSAAERLLREGHPDQAASLYQQVLQTEPRSKQAALGLALAHAMKGRWNRALPILEELGKRFPQDPTIRLNLAIAQVRLGQLDQGLKNLQVASDLGADAYVVRLHQGVALRALGRLEEALKAYQAAHRLRPHQLPPLWNMAIALDRAGRFQEAKAIYQRMLDDFDMADGDKRRVQDRLAQISALERS
ncbi:Tetratricopeptide repeat-containing protein [Desulfacinum hydrothermale DSM 13146]|uniref:Tetratricopeptide repeat-containing protein n=1 Tax=Desulfacinum hydrothermale DSM 13146 TaxID=1121390 RepID=A0A1W1X5N9_9BACT|nr:Tetratricopeptide repeat-containing protein [Desulfacinum hydrothermale DSM 13146]